MKPHEKGLGLLGQSPPDYRDLIYTAPSKVMAALPDHVDLRQSKGCPLRIFDQGQLGSCAPHAGNTVAQFVEKLDSDPDWNRLSMLWTYWYAREKIGTTSVDSGSMIRDVFDVIHEKGVPRASLWPYDIEKFTVKPDTAAQKRSAIEHRAIEYRSVPDGVEAMMTGCLSEGYPFAYGFAVYRSFWNIGPNGRWDGETGEIDGYHAVTAFGYDFRPGAFGFTQGGYIVRNQWAEDWGDGGYFYVPRDYMKHEAFDCWTIRKVTH